jgi:hypothetical protein
MFAGVLRRIGAGSMFLHEFFDAGTGLEMLRVF